MARTMKQFIALSLAALCFASASAFSWGRVFGDSSDVGEASAKEMERGRTSRQLTKFRKTSNDHKAKASVEQLGPVEAPLPAEDSVDIGSRNVSNSKASKQVIEPALASVEEDVADERESKHEASSASPGSISDPFRPERSEGKVKIHNVPEDSYGTIKKEIEDMTKQLGPEVPDSEKEKREGEGLEGSGDHPSSHPALTKGIEQAIAGLTSVYNTLRASDRNDRSIPSETSERQAQSHRFEESNDLTRRGAENNFSGALEVTSPIRGLVTNSTTSTNSTDAESASDGSIKAEGSDSRVGEKAATGVSALAIIGGIALVGAVGLIVMGYRQNLEAPSQQAPLYPPRGPSFV